MPEFTKRRNEVNVDLIKLTAFPSLAASTKTDIDIEKCITCDLGFANWKFLKARSLAKPYSFATLS